MATPIILTYTTRNKKIIMIMALKRKIITAVYHDNSDRNPYKTIIYK